MAQLNIDVTAIEPDTGYDTVPAGWYNVAADESDLKPTKDGAGTYLQMRFNILDGQYQGRKLFTRLNIRNANVQAQEIALRQLSAIGHAVGVLQIADSQQLHGRPLKVRAKIRAADGEYEASNEIVSYKNINEVVDMAGAAPAAAAPPAAAFTPPPVAAAPAAAFVPPAAAAPAAAVAQPWAAPPLAAAPAADPANPFAGAPVAAVAEAAPAQAWTPPVAAAPVAAAPVAEAAVAAAPVAAAAPAAGGVAPPPWAQQPAA